MKKIWEKIKPLNKSKKFQLISSIVIILGSFVVSLLNMFGLIPIKEEKLLSLIILLLCNVAFIYILEDLDVFEEIKKQLSELPAQIEIIENETFKTTENEFHNIDEQLRIMGHKLTEVHKLIKDTHTTKGVIIGRNSLERSRSLDELWNGADEVCLLAIANTSFLKGNGISRIKDGINKGIKFKLITLNPECKALIDDYDESGIISPTSLPVGANVNSYIRNCNSNPQNRRQRETKNFKAMVEMRLTTYLLPYSMMIVKKSGRIHTIKVDLYGVNIDYVDRRSFYIPAEDEDNIAFYEEQWNTIWEDSEKTVPVDLTRNYN